MRKIILSLAATIALVAVSDTAEARRKRPANYEVTVVEHPAGCPRSRFCGCGSSAYVFGAPVRELYLAANWFGFPGTLPSSGMAGVRYGHVFILKEHRGGDNWLVYDPNSGGRQTRIHVRSIRGLKIVDPHGQNTRVTVRRSPTSYASAI